MAIRRSISKKPDFELADWYQGESAKRNFGRICQAVNDSGRPTTLLGAEDEPWLALEDADEHQPQADEVTISIEDAKANWSAVTTAAMIFGTRFRIKGKIKTRAVLFKNTNVQHPAERYARAPSTDLNALAKRIEELAKEVRLVGRGLKKRMIGDHAFRDLGLIAEKIGASADVIDRRFREIWRDCNGHSGGATITYPKSRAH